MRVCCLGDMCVPLLSLLRERGGGGSEGCLPCMLGIHKTYQLLQRALVCLYLLLLLLLHSTSLLVPQSAVVDRTRERKRWRMEGVCGAGIHSTVSC